MSVPSIITRAPDGLDSIRRYPVWSSGDWGDEVAMPTRMAVKRGLPKRGTGLHIRSFVHLPLTNTQYISHDIRSQNPSSIQRLFRRETAN